MKNIINNNDNSNIIQLTVSIGLLQSRYDIRRIS